MPRRGGRWAWLGDFPTQQGFALVVIAMWLPTCWRALENKPMNADWLSTLLGLSFTVVLHYGVKRWSFKPGVQDVDVAPPPPPSSPGASP